MTKQCIMNIGDWVSSTTVNRLTNAQWKQFRSYLRRFGYQIDDEYGNYITSYKHDWCVFLDEDGDLYWTEQPDDVNQVTYEQITQVIEPTRACIMNIGDYIPSTDVNKLTPDQWEKFREYLRVYGYRVNDRYGQLSRFQLGNPHFGIILDEDGDLSWVPSRIINQTRAIPFELIIQAIGSNTEHTTNKLTIVELAQNIQTIKNDIDILNQKLAKFESEMLEHLRAK